jgi:GNAT superfamily N-acetyltransferase
MVNFKIKIIGNSEQIKADIDNTFITFRIKNSRAIIDYILVNHKYRNQGIGTELIKRFEDIAISRGVKKVYLRACQWDNILEKNIIKFYYKNGFETINDYKGIGMQMYKNLK